MPEGLSSVRMRVPPREAEFEKGLDQIVWYANIVERIMHEVKSAGDKIKIDDNKNSDQG